MKPALVLVSVSMVAYMCGGEYLNDKVNEFDQLNENEDETDNMVYAAMFGGLV